MQLPETRYAWNGKNSFAYQVVGDGPVDLVYLQGYLSNVILQWEHPSCARFLRDLAGFSRLIVTDRRGLGCSERFTADDIPPIETLADDLLAVLDAAGSERAVLFATGDCGFIAIPFAASHPDRVAALVLHETAATWRKTDETPWGTPEEERESERQRVCCGPPEDWFRVVTPSLTTDAESVAWCVRYALISNTPSGCLADSWRFGETDLRGVLDAIQVPTLVMYREEAEHHHLDSGFLASRIRTARLVTVKGSDHLPWGDTAPGVVREVEHFLASVRAEEADLDRALATVLFTDIVGSTEKVAELGDAGWRELVERHHRAVRALLARYRGSEIDTAGDGFFASFDGPARAVRCAEAAVEAVRPLGVEIRAGVHTGEVETIDGKVGGIAVNIGARIGGLAGSSEVLVSQTVKDLVAGSGLRFEERGEHTLKGVPGSWRVFASTADAHG
ncbi:MAG TPA: adenylate/guanylate cyclase domain-containing protein [Gaiellaceae bacterium]|nr:adenylate/guanylate cyclase domain-containing protein [Gaiellaceae bacterium]